MEKPNVSFSRPGSIFADSNIYDRVFPYNDFGEILRRGDRAATRMFLLQRLVPVRLLVKNREYLRSRTPETADRKWRSCSYHLLWMLRKLFDDLGDTDLGSIYQHYDQIVDTALPQLCDSFFDFLTTIQAEIPKDLKSETSISAVLQRGFLSQSGCRDVKRIITGILSRSSLEPPNIHGST